MKVEKIILENFRAYKGRQEIEVEDFVAFVGKNDQGKSTILEALEIFFNEGDSIVKLQGSDMNIDARNEGDNVFRIGVIFSEVPDQIVIDSTNPTSLRDEYLLNADGKLEVWKEYREDKLKRTFIKCYHPCNDELKDLILLKIDKLKDKAKELGIKDADMRTAAEIRRSIRNYVEGKEKLKFVDTEISIDSDSTKEIWTKIKEYMPSYALFQADRKNQEADPEVQDPLNTAVIQILNRSDIKAKLEEIAAEVINEVRGIAEKTKEKFKELSEDKIDIKPSIPSVERLKWKDVFKNMGFVTDNEIPLNKRGSGIRRLMLLSFFLTQVEHLDDKGMNETSKAVIYAIEEPETGLHPEKQIQLLQSLQRLSESGRYQVFITTHSPQFIRLLPLKSIRYVEGGKVFRIENNEELKNRMIKNMGLLPNVGKVIWCVEGRNDETFLRQINKSIPELREIIDLEKAIDSGLLAFNIMNGANCEDYVSRYLTKYTNAVEFHLYDRDSDEKYRKVSEQVNRRNDGSKAVLTKKREMENYIPRHLIESEFGIDLSDIGDWDNADIPKIILERYKKTLNKKDIKERLNGRLSKKITKKDLEMTGAWDEIVSWFENIAEMVDKCTNLEKD